jgi:hypothetical protein
MNSSTNLRGIGAVPGEQHRGDLRGFGIPRGFIRSVFATWPDAGFHWRLVQLTLHRFRTHPLSPLPMVKL